MNNIFQIIGVTSLCSTFILRFIDWIVAAVKKKYGKHSEEEKAYNEAMKFLLREKLIDKTNEAISQGYREYARDHELRQGYEAYQALGGNGTMKDKWEHEYIVLPLK